MAVVTAATMVITFIPTFAFATDEEYDPQETKEMAREYKSENVYENNECKEILSCDVDQDALETSNELSEADTLDAELLEEISEEADIEIEQIDKNTLYLDVEVEEPIETITYEDGSEVKEFEKYGLIVENDTSVETDDIVEEISDDITSNNAINWIEAIAEKFVDASYANSTDERYQSYGAIKATIRVVYQQTNSQFVKYVKSSIKMSEKKRNTTLKKLVLKCRVKADYTRSTAKWERGKGKSIDKSNTTTFNSPKFGTWYNTSSPTSLYCWKCSYWCQCNTYATVTWKRNNKTYSHEFMITHMDSVL